MLKSLCFYFPYYEDSGVPVLFYRLANFIAHENPSIKVYLIDYKNGAMARHIAQLENIKLIPYVKGVKLIVPENSVLIMQSFLPYYWPDDLKLDYNQKILFWNLHPYNLVPSLLPFPFLRELPKNSFRVYKFLSIFYKDLIFRLNAFVQLLLDSNSICFMDKTNLDVTSKYLFLNIPKQKYLPVPAVHKKAYVTSNKTFLEKDTINIGWIGRLCDFKSYILVYTINKLSEISSRFNDKELVYHIVGEGPYLKYIKDNLKISSTFSVVFHGSISHDKLDSFIDRNFDIVTAMGTSALEGAKLAKPTILLDFTYKKVKKDYKFRLIYDTEGFDLAHLITESDYESCNDSLFKIINDIIENYNYHSKKSLDYFNSNHSIETISQLLLQKAHDSKLIFSMIDPLILKKGLLLNAYNKMRKL